MNRLRVWLELCRLPHIFTVMADPLAGALLAGATWRHSLFVPLLMVASGCMYAGGAAFRDWYNFKGRPAASTNGPLVSQYVYRFKALLWSIGLLLLGGLLASIPNTFSTKVGILLVTAIWIHSLLAEHVPVAPVILGGCRSLNLLLGMTLVPMSESCAPLSMRSYLMVAVGIYIVGIVVFAGRKTGWNSAKRLVAGGALTLLGVVLVALLGFFFPDDALHRRATTWAAILLLVVGYRMTQAILTPKPQNIRVAVKTAMIGAILLDATMVAFSRGLLLSLLVALLLVPALAFKKQVPACSS